VTRLIAELDKLLNDGVERKGKFEAARTVHLREMLPRLRLTSKDVTLLLGVLRDIKNKERRSKD
jgi:tRNA C32,U32 (ribose-2'-O)-methylase TrmJ